MARDPLLLLPALVMLEIARILLSTMLSTLGYASASSWPCWLAAAAVLLDALRRLKSGDCDLRMQRHAHLPDNAFAGKVIWCTGASSGIGEAAALQFAARGARLVLSARRVERLRELEPRCRAAGAADVLVLPLDALALKSHAAKAQEIVERFGRIDVLLANAGRSQRSLIEQTAVDVDRAVMELNYLGTLSVTKAVLPHMCKQQRGWLLVTGSVAGKTGSPISASYAASKMAVESYFNTLRMELYDRNIGVTLVLPGPVLTEGQSSAFTSKMGETFGKAPSAEEAKQRLTAERCGFLMAAALYHQLDEVWLSCSPILWYVYGAQYLPTLYSAMAKKTGVKRAQAFRRGGDAGYTALSGGIFSSLFGGKKKAS